MAKSGITSPASALGEITRFTELRQRLLFLVGSLVVYRIGTYIPVPGIDPMLCKISFKINLELFSACSICFLEVL